MSVQFWMNLQSNYELAVAYRHSQDVIEKQVLPREAPAV
jgi:plasmid maintenance system antidote protein VapI